MLELVGSPIAARKIILWQLGRYAHDTTIASKALIQLQLDQLQQVECIDCNWKNNQVTTTLERLTIANRTQI